MSEKLHSHGEKGPEPIDTSAEQKRHGERLREASEREDAQSKEHVHEIAHKAKHEAVSGKELAERTRQEASNSPVGTQKELKNMAYKRTLARVRDQLSAPSRVFSKVVHQPVVEKVSNISAQTVARPSGILGGGVFALLGSSFVLYFARRYGFEYNYLLFAALFVGGFFLGLLLELAIRLLARNRRHAD